MKPFKLTAYECPKCKLLQPATNIKCSCCGVEFEDDNSERDKYVKKYQDKLYEILDYYKDKKMRIYHQDKKIIDLMNGFIGDLYEIYK